MSTLEIPAKWRRDNLEETITALISAEVSAQRKITEQGRKLAEARREGDFLRAQISSLQAIVDENRERDMHVALLSALAASDAA